MANGEYGEAYERALVAAAKWHGDQKRKGSGVPYISHLLTVSALVWEDGGSETEAIAALLHDVVEDGRASIDAVRAEFGPEVAVIVENCSDAVPVDGAAKPPWFERKVDHIDHLRSIASTPESGATLRVVAADKLANVRSMVVDHRRGKPDFWERFKGGLGGSVWYYAEMSRLVEQRLSPSMLVAELALAVESLGDLMVELAGPLHGADLRIASVLGAAATSEESDATRYLAFELARTTSTSTEETELVVASVLRRWFGEPPPSGTADQAPCGDRAEVHAAVMNLLEP